LSGLDPLRTQIAEVARRRVESAASAMTNDLKQQAPVDSGELRRKTGVDVTTETKTLIRAEAVMDVEYADIVVGGSRPHVIRGNPLAFRWPKAGPGIFFFRSVNHPGTKPNLFFEQITKRWTQYLERAG